MAANNTPADPNQPTQQNQTDSPNSWKEARAEWIRRWRDPITLFTAFLVILGGVQWCTIHDTDKSIRGQLGVLEKQLEEMKQSFSADRAYVLLARFQGGGVEGAPPGTQGIFIFKNYGRTPAEIRMAGGQCTYSTSGYPTIATSANVPGVTDEKGQIPAGADILDAGKERHPFFVKSDATADQIQQARIGNGKIYCRVVIAYNDMRSLPHETASCFVYNFGANAFLACPEKDANYYK